MASGLFDWIKPIEVVLGLTMLLNRAMPLTIIALVPLNAVIVYWNFVLDEGAVEWTFARSASRSTRTRMALAALFLAAVRVEGPAGLWAAAHHPPSPDLVPPPFSSSAVLSFESIRADEAEPAVASGTHGGVPDFLGRRVR